MVHLRLVYAAHTTVLLEIRVTIERFPIATTNKTASEPASQRTNRLASPIESQRNRNAKIKKIIKPYK